MRNCLIVLMAILAFACSNNNVPKGILTDKEIIPVLLELHLAEAIYTQRYALEITRENYQEDLYLTILKKYKLDQKVFEASVLYYGKHPDKYKPIYDEILNRLNEMEVKARAKDSIESRKPAVKEIVKDTLRANDTIQTKKTGVTVKINDSIKILDVKARANIALKNRKPVAKRSIKDSVKVIP
jgi:hypothetical protein